MLGKLKIYKSMQKRGNSTKFLIMDLQRRFDLDHVLSQPGRCKKARTLCLLFEPEHEKPVKIQMQNNWSAPMPNNQNWSLFVLC
jgi:hypothetical protein